MDNDEVPLTPMGRLCIRPEHNHVILCAIGFTHPINIDALKNHISNFILVKVPRFSSLLVLDPFDGSECWKPTRVQFDDHFFIHDDDDKDGMSSEEDIINSYLDDMVMSSPLRLDKPLWELHVMPKHKFMIMKVHHALADGTSLMSMLWSMGRPRSDEFHGHSVGDMNGRMMDKKSGNAKLDDGDNGNESALVSMGRRIWQVLVNIWYNVVFGLNYIWYSLVFGLNYTARVLWVKDKIDGIEGVDLWQRKVETARFSLADMKTIKKAIPNATVHDVIYGIVWCGLIRYLNVRHPQALEHGVQLTGMCPTNMREQPGLQDLSTMVSETSRSPWGNRFTMILLPIIYHTKQHALGPLTYVRRAKSVMDRKKQSMEAYLSYKLGRIATTLIGPKIPSWVLFRLFKNTTFLLSNIIGPPEEIFIADNPVTFIRITTSSNQPQAIIMHMVSYMGKVDLQIQVAKEVFADPKFLVTCFQDSLLNMKIAA